MSTLDNSELVFVLKKIRIILLLLETHIQFYSSSSAEFKQALTFNFFNLRTNPFEKINLQQPRESTFHRHLNVVRSSKRTNSYAVDNNLIWKMLSFIGC